jgi:hypothetical protein
MNYIGYLTPEGKIIECEAYEHTELASEIIDSMIEQGIEVPPEAKMSGFEAESYLLTLGYIVIERCGCYGNIGCHIDGKEQRLHLTKEQKKWLEDHYAEFTSSKQKEIDKLFEEDK